MPCLAFKIMKPIKICLISLWVLHLFKLASFGAFFSLSWEVCCVASKTCLSLLPVSFQFTTPYEKKRVTKTSLKGIWLALSLHRYAVPQKWSKANFGWCWRRQSSVPEMKANVKTPFCVSYRTWRRAHARYFGTWHPGLMTSVPLGLSISRPMLQKSSYFVASVFKGAYAAGSHATSFSQLTIQWWLKHLSVKYEVATKGKIQFAVLVEKCKHFG